MVRIMKNIAWPVPQQWWLTIIAELRSKYTDEEWNNCAFNLVTEFFAQHGARYNAIGSYNVAIDFENEEDATAFTLRYGL